MSRTQRRISLALIIGVIISTLSYVAPKPEDLGIDPYFSRSICSDYEYTMRGIPLSFAKHGQFNSYCASDKTIDRYSVVNYFGDVLFWASISFVVVAGVSRWRSRK